MINVVAEILIRAGASKATDVTKCVYCFDICWCKLVLECNNLMKWYDILSRYIGGPPTKCASNYYFCRYNHMLLMCGTIGGIALKVSGDYTYLTADVYIFFLFSMHVCSPIYTSEPIYYVTYGNTIVVLYVYGCDRAMVTGNVTSLSGTIYMSYLLHTLTTLIWWIVTMHPIVYFGRKKWRIITCERVYDTNGHTPDTLWILMCIKPKTLITVCEHARVRMILYFLFKISSTPRMPSLGEGYWCLECHCLLDKLLLCSLRPVRAVRAQSLGLKSWRMTLLICDSNNFFLFFAVSQLRMVIYGLRSG